MDFQSLFLLCEKNGGLEMKRLEIDRLQGKMDWTGWYRWEMRWTGKSKDWKWTEWKWT